MWVVEGVVGGSVVGEGDVLRGKVRAWNRGEDGAIFLLSVWVLG